MADPIRIHSQSPMAAVWSDRGVAMVRLGDEQRTADLLFNDAAAVHRVWTALGQLLVDSAQFRRASGLPAFPGCPRCIADAEPGRIDGEALLHNHPIALTPADLTAQAGAR